MHSIIAAETAGRRHWRETRNKKCLCLWLLYCILLFLFLQLLLFRFLPLDLTLSRVRSPFLSPEKKYVESYRRMGNHACMTRLQQQHFIASLHQSLERPNCTKSDAVFSSSPRTALPAILFVSER